MRPILSTLQRDHHRWAWFAIAAFSTTAVALATHFVLMTRLEPEANKDVALLELGRIPTVLLVQPLRKIGCPANAARHRPVRTGQTPPRRLFISTPLPTDESEALHAWSAVTGEVSLLQ